jgi:hypothetical protein
LSTIYTEPEREAVLSTFHRIYAGLEDTDGLVGTKNKNKKIAGLSPLHRIYAGVDEDTDALVGTEISYFRYYNI